MSLVGLSKVSSSVTIESLPLKQVEGEVTGGLIPYGCVSFIYQ